MEEDQEHKHVCKFCNKSFPCGRSLGGHMRSHMKSSSAKTKEKLNKKKTISSSVDDGGNNSNNNSTFMLDFEAGGSHGAVYGLRENPKKSWRFSDSSDGNLMHNQVCKECGKGFQSSKALFGHMRSHVERDRVSINTSLEEEYLWTGENQKLVMDSQSDNEAVVPKRRRRTRRTRYKSTTTTTTTTTTSSSSLSLVNASINSEFEQEQEEVAICLMMLSRDVGYWGGLDSVVDSSDNNSIVLEVRSTKKLEEIKDFSGEKSSVKMKKPRDKKLEACVWDSGNAGLKRKLSELGGFNFGLKKVESEVSVDGLFGKDGFKKPATENEAVFKVFDDELGKGFTNEDRIKCTDTEVMKNMIKQADEHGDSVFVEYNSSKKTKYSSEERKVSPKKLKYDALDSEIDKISPKKSKYECTTCNKIFPSYQALGGHKASHKKIKNCFSSRIESSETSIETEVSPDPSAESNLIKSCSLEKPMKREGEISCIAKKSKHECPVCFRVFSSGQALGGHKRSHLIENSEVRGNQNTVIPQQIPEIHDLLDLNLPAPIEEEMKAQIEFNPWWAGSNHNSHEPPVGMLSH